MGGLLGVPGVQDGGLARGSAQMVKKPLRERLEQKTVLKCLCVGLDSGHHGCDV